MSTVAKKRKAAANGNTAVSKKQVIENVDRAVLHDEVSYQALTLQDIHDRIANLCRMVPLVPESGFRLDRKLSDCKTTDGAPTTPPLPQPLQECHYDKSAVRTWATALQTVLEEFHLLVACVSPATYKWGTDRSGAADQNLNLLSNELVRSQEQIISRVSPRLTDVLAPVVSLVTSKTVTTKTEEGEVKQNFFITTHEDPDYVDLSYTILARNAKLLRQVVLANFDKLLQALQDYLDAQHKDSQHDSRGFVY